MTADRISSQKSLPLIRRPLLNWYDAHRRRLPWREQPSPYRTWISEIMLQQTQVATVLPYYERFLKRFPDIAALARADESQILKYWAGLGYYSRARNLRRAAREIVGRHGGRFPSTFEEALALPGIGRYTAGAILSIAFGKPCPVLDGNVMRVFARLFAMPGDIKTPAAQKKMWALAETLLDPSRPGDWNQALMELGALVCVPESPRCLDCPLALACAARGKGLQDELPRMPRPRDPVSLHWTCLWIQREGKVLLWKRSEAERFLPGHWGLPETRHLPKASRPKNLSSFSAYARPNSPQESSTHYDANPKAAGTARRPRNAAMERNPIVVRHAITHHRIALELRRAFAPARPPAQARWIPRSKLKDYLVSSLWLKAARAAERARQIEHG